MTPPVNHPTFKEILAPVHQEVRESGIQEGQLDSLLESALCELRQEKRRKSTSDQVSPCSGTSN